MNKEFKYFAFISYKREDEKWARWLHRKLESYRLPSVIANEKPDLPKRLNPVFRDTTDIKPGILDDVLRQNLEDSKYLIVVCSPRAAKSEWVGKEISDFIEFGKQENVILFIIDGKPYCNDPELECYHTVIKVKLPEMLGVNVNEESKEWKFIKKQKAFIRVVSTLLDVSFDSLWGRQKRRIIWNTMIYSFFTILFILTLTAIRIHDQQTNAPFNVRILLKERTPHNQNLPFENGIIKLCYNKDTIPRHINRIDDVAEFDNIPGKYKGVKANAKFEMFGYLSHDTIIALNTNNQFLIFRDSAYSVVQGNVRDKITDQLLPDIFVEIEGKQTITNKEGFFRIGVPIERQNTNYQVTLRKNDKIVNGQMAYPTKNEPSLLNTLYFR